MKKTKKKVETETTEKETKPDTEAEGSEEETEEESTEEETEVESEEDKDSNIDIDHKAEAKKERERRKKAEKALAKERFKKSKARREEEVEDESDDDDEEDDKPVTRKELGTILDKDRKKRTLSKAKDIASSISDSVDEANHVMEVYKSHTFPTHLTLKQKLQEAYLIANAPKIIGQNDELKRALKGKGLSSGDGSTTHQDPPQSSEPSISNMDKTVLQQVGFNWVGANKRWEKKLQNGKTLVREKDKTGKWITRPLST